eukprot:1157445-Pelagomonas_calceolata.AAC.16
MESVVIDSTISEGGCAVRTCPTHPVVQKARGNSRSDQLSPVLRVSCSALCMPFFWVWSFEILDLSLPVPCLFPRAGGNNGGSSGSSREQHASTMGSSADARGSGLQHFLGGWDSLTFAHGHYSKVNEWGRNTNNAQLQAVL